MKKKEREETKNSSALILSAERATELSMLELVLSAKKDHTNFGLTTLMLLVLLFFVFLSE